MHWLQREPWENAGYALLMQTAKTGGEYRQACRDLAETRVSIECFIEEVCNLRQLHSALDCRPPAEFEQILENSQAGERV
jgi:hypothetical protein